MVEVKSCRSFSSSSVAGLLPGLATPAPSGAGAEKTWPSVRAREFARSMSLRIRSHVALPTNERYENTKIGKARITAAISNFQIAFLASLLTWHMRALSPDTGLSWLDSLVSVARRSLRSSSVHALAVLLLAARTDRRRLSSISIPASAAYPMSASAFSSSSANGSSSAEDGPRPVASRGAGPDAVAGMPVPERGGTASPRSGGGLRPRPSFDSEYPCFAGSTMIPPLPRASSDERSPRAIPKPASTVPGRPDRRPRIKVSPSTSFEATPSPYSAMAAIASRLVSSSFSPAKPSKSARWAAREKASRRVS